MGPSNAVERTQADTVETSAAVVGEVIEALRVMAEAQGRADLVARLEDAAWRVARTEMLVCVVGEFKKGKSALINALLNQDVCPVDDDLSTAAVTVVRHDDEPRVTVRRRREGKLVVETVPPDEVARWVVEHDEADSRRGVELVEIGLPHPLLARGIALVDTPGVGGLNAAHAIATLAFLPSADALVFVTDASAELSAPELDFLRRARDAGPPIIVAITKIDMHPEWRRIVELDESHLAAAGVVLKAIPVSAALRAAGERLGDEALIDESGLPRLHDAIILNATDGARGTAVSIALAEVMPAIEQLREPIETELTVLERPEAAERVAAELRSVQDRLATLSRADTRWSTWMDGEFDALRTRVVFALQAGLRQRLREVHEEIERVDPSGAWSDLAQRLQTDVAAIVRTAFVQSTDAAARVQTGASEMLADADEAFTGTTSPMQYEIAEAWRGSLEFGGRAQFGVLAAVGVLGGAAAGIEMLSLLGTLVGAAIAGPAAIGVIGVSLVFAGKQVVDERRRLLADRRQQARAHVSGFVEDVRFEVEGRLAALLGDLERQMRSHFAERIRQLQRTNEEALEALQRAVQERSGERELRLEELRQDLAALDDLQARAVASALASPVRA